MRSRAWPLHLLLAGFVAVACIYMSFLEPWGHDTWFHLQRLQDVEQQLGRGQLRMHFAENAAQGKGIRVGLLLAVGLPAGAVAAFARCQSAHLAQDRLLRLSDCSLRGCYRLLKREADSYSGIRDASLRDLELRHRRDLPAVGVRRVSKRRAAPLLLVALQRTLLRQNRRAPAALVLLATLMILFDPLSFMNAGYAIAAYAVYVVVDRRNRTRV